MTTKTIKEILDFDLIRELDLQDLPKEKQIAVLSQFSDILLARIMQKITNQASYEELKQIKNQFKKLEQNNSSPKLNDFLKIINTEIKDFNKILGKEIFKMKNELSKLFAEN